MRATLLLRLLAAFLGGAALWLSLPEHNLWWLAPVGVALAGASVFAAGAGRGALAGLVTGVAMFVPTLSWTGVYVGALPWLALAVAESAYLAGIAALVGWGTRRLSVAGHPWPALALIPTGWVVQELLRGTVPWGGFPWARLAYSQADSPLVHLARWFGAPGVTLAVAVIGTGLLALILGARYRRPRIWVPGVVIALVPWLAGGITLPHDGPTEVIGFVQGNVPEAGLEFNAERRAVLDNHVRGTEELATQSPDDLRVVVWPENASDIDPLRNPDAAAQVQRAVQAADVPLVVGAVLSEPVGANSNVSLLYSSEGALIDRYTKIHPVPFAEYIPYRSFFRLFTPAADLAGNFVAGDTIATFAIPTPEGSFALIPTICFEVAYDSLMRDAVLAADGEPSVLAVQTNNATFGYTAESEQQFAISRLRAIEHGRSVVHVSTVGVSGFIAPDGTVRAKTALFTAAQAAQPVVLRTETTLSDRLGEGPVALIAAAFLVLLVGAGRMDARVGERLSETRS